MILYAMDLIEGTSSILAAEVAFTGFESSYWKQQ